MSIIAELARAHVKQRGNSPALRAAVLVAVIMLGTLLFIYSELELSAWRYHKELFGDFHVQLLGLSAADFQPLTKNEAVARIELAKPAHFTDLPFRRPEVSLYLQMPALLDTLFSSEVRSLEGMLPQGPREVLVPKLFVLENPEYALGSTVLLGSEAYTICGTFPDHLYSFEQEYRFFGQLAFADPKELFADGGTVDVTIWFHSERDTYSLTRQILAELGKGEEELLKAGALHYNTRYLEGKLIFPSGLIPSREFVERWSLRVFLLACAIPLFVIMIYNAFNVWSSQDLRRIGLLKSSGMTPKQVQRMVIREALQLSLGPILLGLVLSYAFTNTVFYLMWLNNKTAGVGYGALAEKFSWVKPSPWVFVFLFFLAMFCVLVAALKPAWRSSRLAVVEAIKGAAGEKNKVPRRSAEYGRNIARSLAKDNYLSSRHSFRGMAVAMALAGLVFSTVLVFQAQRNLEERYDTPTSPYNLTCTFFTVQKAPQALWEDLKDVPNAHELHVLSSFSLRYLPEENGGFLSEEFLSARGEDGEYRPAVTIYGLADQDFSALLQSMGLAGDQPDGFLLLDRTAEDPKRAYSQRRYIPLSAANAAEVVAVDEWTEERYRLKIAGRVEEFPYELNPLWPDEIALFTSLSQLEEFRLAKGLVDPDRPLTYKIKVSADLEDLTAVTDAVLAAVWAYIPESDVFASNELTRAASKKEQYRNELLLTISAQILLVVIGVSNAYNSVHLNLQARTRDLALLRSAGMTAGQLRSMLGYEAYFLIRRVLRLYALLLTGIICAVAARKGFLFSPWQIALNLNFPLLALFFAISLVGVWAATESGRKKALNESIVETLRQH